MTDDNLTIGDRAALRVSKITSSWPFIFLLGIGIYEIIHIYNILADFKPGDTFNLYTSLFTLFLDIIILRGSITLDRQNKIMSETLREAINMQKDQLLLMMGYDEKMIRLEELILAKEDKIIKILEKK